MKRRAGMVESLEPRRMFVGSTPIVVADMPYQSVTNVVQDSAGNIYGTYIGRDAGYIFEVPAGTHAFETIASFGPVGAANTLGLDPSRDLLIDKKGDLFGVADAGGGGSSEGTLWTLPAGKTTIQVIQHFDTTGIFGSYPGGLIMDSSENLFGWTMQGQVDARGFTIGNPTLFELPAHTNALRLIGDNPGIVSLTADSNDNLFGISQTQVFEIPAGTSAPVTLASYPNDQAGFAAGCVLDSLDNLYVTPYGGGAFGSGGVLELPANSRTPQMLASAVNPIVGVLSSPLVDASGNLFFLCSSNGASPSILELPAGGNTLRAVSDQIFGNTSAIQFANDGGILGIGTDSQQVQYVYEVMPLAVTVPPSAMVQFGAVNGHRNVRAQISPTGGGRVTFKLIGPGSGFATTDENAAFDIMLTDTTAATRVLISVTGKTTSPINIGDLYDSGSVNQFIAPAMGVRGVIGFGGVIRRMQLASVANSQISIGGGPTTVIAGAVTNSTFTSNSDLQVAVASGSGCTVNANSMVSLNCRGNFTGYLDALNLGAIVVRGDLTNSVFTAFATYQIGAMSSNEYVPHVIKSVKVLGNVVNTTVRASAFDPSVHALQPEPLYAMHGGRIGPVYVRRSVTGTSDFFAYHLPAFAIIGSKRIKTAGNPLFTN